MCLTTEAFAVFLTILGAQLATPDGQRVTVHATEGDVVWHAVVDDWCTSAPYPDGYLPFLVTTNEAPLPRQ